MKMISKIAGTALTLSVAASGAFAQSLEDAQNAIRAEQYQKAKTILQNLVKTQADKGENYFYLGQIYLKTDYLDSAKMIFQKGVTADAKNSINYAGLGAVAYLEGNQAGAKQNFDKAIADASKKDIMPAIYVARGYVDIPKAYQPGIKPNGQQAIAVLTAAQEKSEKVTSKSPDFFLAQGDAYRAQLKNSEAYQAYSQALTLDPKLVAAQVAIGVGWKQANNYEAAYKEFQKAISMDANFGPTYREMAETKLQEATNATDTTKYKQSLKEGVDNYKTYLAKTDKSLDSRVRFADFLVYAQDYKGLEQEAAALAQMDKTGKNLKVQRFLAYAKYENGDYQGALDALQKFMQTAGEKRIIPRDYLYLGRIQSKLGQDTAAIANLKKAITLDTTQVDLLDEIAKSLYAKKQYEAAGDTYALFTDKSKKATLADRVRGGLAYYLAFFTQYQKKEADANAPAPNKELLTKADSAYSYAQSKAAKPSAQVELFRARVNNAKEPDANTISGLAKPFYEKYIQLENEAGGANKPGLAEAYAYLGAYYAYTEKNNDKATENFNKAKEFDPSNQQAAYYFQQMQKTKAGGKGK
ncbi:MAG: hypothetical protein INR69_05265 [Mucilaginibacter polytrichastri]|nr:hypothetical protein [Mucilaginibacter polytrichastri]